jgi:hypothetical protein
MRLPELSGVGEVEGAEMNEQIAEQKQRQSAEHRQVAPVLAREDLSCNDRQEHGRETDFGDRGGGCSDLAG